MFIGTPLRGLNVTVVGDQRDSLFSIHLHAEKMVYSSCSCQEKMKGGMEYPLVKHADSPLAQARRTGKRLSVETATIHSVKN